MTATMRPDEEIKRAWGTEARPEETAPEGYVVRYIVTESRIDLRLGSFPTEAMALEWATGRKTNQFSITKEYVRL